MPISYGQVKGRKYTNVQPIHDPDNPKPSRYAPKRDMRRTKPLATIAPKNPKENHGTTTSYRKGCRCDACKLAASKAAERNKLNRLEKHMKDGMARCRICKTWRPVDEFPSIRAKNGWRYVCESCKAKGLR